jgi:glutathione S-transferase
MEGFRYAEGLPLFQTRMRVIPEAAESLKALAQDGLAWFDLQLQGRDFIAGDRFSLADITLFAFLDFGAGVGQGFDPSLENLGAWFERVGGRPSAEASR